jgi:LmbE family N-acetylglucosaminyl deacetylase
MNFKNTAMKIKTFIKKHITNAFQSYFLKKAKDVTPSLPNGCLLVIAPHPDDETLGCAGLIHNYVRADHPVKIVIVTDGAAAQLPDAPSKEGIAATRRKESLHAASILGVSQEHVLFLSYSDGNTETCIDQIKQDIESQLWLYQPALVVSPHSIDAHSDHRTVSSIVLDLKQSGKITCPVWEYPMWFWPKGAIKHFFSPALLASHIKINIKDSVALKQQAIDAHACQKHEENWKQLESYTIAKNLRNEELFFSLDR